jgi:hypothetical protein
MQQINLVQLLWRKGCAATAEAQGHLALQVVLEAGEAAAFQASTSEVFCYC